MTILAMFVARASSITVARTAEKEWTVPGGCPHPEGWKPADFPRILAEHGKWVERQSTEEDFSQGRANLCNADLSGAKLINANLRSAKLNNANLSWAQLNNADLGRAELNNADLSAAQLNNANLSWAKLINANLRSAKLNNANLSWANVDRAQLSYADVRGAIYAPASPPPDFYVGSVAKTAWARRGYQ